MDEGLYLPNVKYYEMRKVSDFGGARIRIMKGFSIGGGQAKSHDELTEIDEGYLNYFKYFGVCWTVKHHFNTIETNNKI